MLAPRENTRLFGHQEARQSFIQAFHSPRCPHAWILGGPFGIGKATFAFHYGRYVLSGRQDGRTHFEKNDPLFRRTIARSHGDLWTVDGEEGEEIGVEPIRNLVHFLQQTPGEGGWRVLIIEGAERLNRNAANALLKSLEEPPAKTLFFLTTAFPERLLATLRSRCHFLSLSPLGPQDLEAVLVDQGLTPPSSLEMAEGSPGRLMRFMEEERATLYEELHKVFEGGESLSLVHQYGEEATTFGLIEEYISTFLHGALLAKVENSPSFFDQLSLDKSLSLYEKVQDLFSQCRSAHLEKKITLACVFYNIRTVSKVTAGPSAS